MNNFLSRALFLCVLLVAMLQENASAQRPAGRSTGTADLQILKKIKSFDFFVNDEFLAPPLKKLYRRDAVRIALRLIDKEQRIAQQSVDVPEDLRKAIYNALVAVRLSELPQIDTIAVKYNIRTFQNPETDFITLIFEHDAEWAKPIKQFRSDTTANPSINALMRRYSLNITKLANLDDERAGLVLKAKEPINMAALARLFFLEQGIGSIEQMQTFGDGNDITMDLDAEGWIITYSVKFGDCLTTCKKKYEWKFRVSMGGKVTFMKGGGDVIPPWVGATDKKRIEIRDELKDKSGAPKDAAKDAAIRKAEN